MSDGQTELGESIQQQNAAMAIEKKYTYQRTADNRPLHTWSVVDNRGGIHLWIEECGIPNYPYMGGYEVHYRTKPYSWSQDAPDNEDCWLLKGPCWHDGTSSWVSEYWIPRWLADPTNHDAILATMASDMDKRFAEAEA